MPSLSHPLLLPVALATIAVVTALFLALHRNAAAKRRLAPVLVPAHAIALIALVVTLTGANGSLVLLLLVALGAVAVFATLRSARFCDACGSTILPRGIVRQKECPRCGDDLRAQAGARVAGIARDARRQATR